MSRTMGIEEFSAALKAVGSLDSDTRVWEDGGAYGADIEPKIRREEKEDGTAVTYIPRVYWHYLTPRHSRPRVGPNGEIYTIYSDHVCGYPTCAEDDEHIYNPRPSCPAGAERSPNVTTEQKSI